MTYKIDWCARLRALASGELTGEIPAFEYALAADEIDRLHNALQRIRNLDPETDSDCFGKAQKIVADALTPNDLAK